MVSLVSASASVGGSAENNDLNSQERKMAKNCCVDGCHGTLRELTSHSIDKDNFMTLGCS